MWARFFSRSVWNPQDLRGERKLTSQESRVRVSAGGGNVLNNKLRCSVNLGLKKGKQILPYAPVIHLSLYPLVCAASLLYC